MADHEPHRGYIDAQGRMDWDAPAAVCAFLRVRFAGRRVEVRFCEEHGGKTKAQADGFHAMITPWARERGWAIDALKQWLLREIFGTVDFVHPRTSEVVEVLAEPHTSALTKAQYGELIERSMQLAAEADGIVLTAPDEYRRQREARRQQAERQQARLAGRGPATTRQEAAVAVSGSARV